MKYLLIFSIILGATACNRNSKLWVSGYANSKTADLFIWVGQSNAQGWMGDAKFYPADPDSLDQHILLNYTFIDNTGSNGKWIQMGPQEGRFPLGHFGPEVSFSREIKRAGYDPYIFKYTKGSTSIYNDWKRPGQGGMYDSMVKDLAIAVSTLEQAGVSVNIRGFIWIQGESDAENDKMAHEFEDNLIRIIADLKEVTNNNELKVILGVDEQHSWVSERPIVVEAQKNIAALDPNISFTSMIGLPKADATHLTPLGLVEHGKIISEAFKKMGASK